MADQLGTTIGAVRGQLQRGKQLLAQRLRRRGLVPVLAIAASMASTVSQAQAQSTGKTFLQTMDGSSIPESPIDTSLLKSFLNEGVRVMKAPYLTCLVATATILIALAAMTDSGIGGDNHQPATIDDVVQFPAILAQVRQMPTPQFVAVQANDENGKVQSGQTDESGESTDSTKLIWTDKTVVPKPTSAIARKAEEVLDQVVPIVENNMHLSEWAETLSASINVPVELSSQALALAKLDPNSTSILMKNESLPLRLVFRKALQPLGLKVVVQDEGLVITADLLAQVRSGNNASRWINVDEEPEKIIAEALDRPPIRRTS